MKLLRLHRESSKRCPLSPAKLEVSSFKWAGRIPSKPAADPLWKLPNARTTSSPNVDATIFDGAAAVVQMLNTGTATTFQEYAEPIFIPYI